MNETLLDATLKVIIDGQSYLYAHTIQLDMEAHGHVVTDKMFEGFEDDWKNQTAELILELVAEEEE